MFYQYAEEGKKALQMLLKWNWKIWIYIQKLYDKNWLIFHVLHCS